MLNLKDILWAGTEASYHDAVQLETSLLTNNIKANAAVEGADNTSEYYSKVGNVAVIPIKGSLVNADIPWLKYFGITTYPDIRRALVAAALDGSVSKILLDVDSGGGAVAGVEDTAAVISKVDKSVKPVITFSGGTMASAAYWLGATARKVHLGDTALAGSIGVIAVHTEYSKARQEAGIKSTVIRAGKYKALANPIEKLSDEAREIIQGHLDETYKVFATHVAEARNVTYKVADEKMGQGREFIGEQALEAGLVDSITSFNALLDKLQDTKPVDKTKPLYDNGIIQKRGSLMATKDKSVLTEQDIAAIASGATGIVAGEPAADPVQPAAEAKADGQEAAATTDEVAAAGADNAGTDTKAAAEAGADPKTGAEIEGTLEATSAPSVVDFLQAQIKEKDEAILATTVANKDLEKRVADMEAAHTPLLEIARNSIGKMQVALGGSAIVASDLTAMQLVAMHAQLLERFKEKFKVGGVAASNVTSEKAKDSAAEPLHSAKIAAVRVKRK